MSMIGSRVAALQELRLRSLELIEPHVFKVQRLTVNPARRWSNPVCKFPRLDDASTHQRLNIGIILGTRKPFGFPALPCFFTQDFSVEADEMSREIADRAVKALMRQGQPERNTSAIDHPLPPADSIGNLRSEEHTSELQSQFH